MISWDAPALTSDVAGSTARYRTWRVSGSYSGRDVQRFAHHALPGWQHYRSAMPPDSARVVGGSLAMPLASDPSMRPRLSPVSVLYGGLSGIEANGSGGFRLIFDDIDGIAENRITGMPRDLNSFFEFATQCAIPCSSPPSVLANLYADPISHLYSENGLAVPISRPPLDEAPLGGGYTLAHVRFRPWRLSSGSGFQASGSIAGAPIRASRSEDAWASGGGASYFIRHGAVTSEVFYSIRGVQTRVPRWRTPTVRIGAADFVGGSTPATLRIRVYDWRDGRSGNLLTTRTLSVPNSGGWLSHYSVESFASLSPAADATHYEIVCDIDPLSAHPAFAWASYVPRTSLAPAYGAARELAPGGWSLIPGVALRVATLAHE